jgi:NAD(P)H dehydrogenase (quinone)
MANVLLVHGASGHLGGLIVQLATRRAVAAVRDPAHKAAEVLKSLGVKIVTADYLKKETLLPAYKGVHTVVFVPTPTSGIDRATAADNAATAGREAGIKRFLAVSFGSGRTDSELVLAPAYCYLESVARVSSNAHWLIVRMGIYAENCAADWKAAVAQGFFSVPGLPGSARVPYIARKDIARGIAAAVLQWDLHGKVYDIQPAVAHSLDEIATMISHSSGKKVIYKTATEAEFVKHLEPSWGAAAPFGARLYTTMYRGAANGEFKVTNDLVELTGEPAHPMKEFIAELLKQH